MATIDSIQFYLKRTMTYTLGETLTVKLYDSADPTADPNDGDLLATKAIDANDILLNAYNWVEFEFDAPVTITGDGFYGVHLYLNGFSQYRASFIYYRETTDASPPSAPFAGDEQIFEWDGDSWEDLDEGIPYKILGTGTGGNSAIELGTERSFVYNDIYRGYGLRAYIVDAAASRQVNLSSPTNAATGVTMHPLLEWTISGTGLQEGDYFFIYLKAVDSDFTEDDLLQGWRTTLNLQIIYGLSYNTTYYWQVQAANEDASLLDSTIWSFTTMSLAPPAPSTRVVGADTLFTGENNMMTVQRLVAAANNKFWYEDVA